MEISPIIRIFSSFTPLLTLEYLGLGKKFQRHISQIKYYPQPGFWASKKGSGWGGPPDATIQPRNISGG